MQIRFQQMFGKSRQKHGNQFGRVGKVNSKVPTDRNTWEKYRAFSPRISDMFRMPGHKTRKMMGFMAGSREIKRNEWFNLPFSLSTPPSQMLTWAYASQTEC